MSGKRTKKKARGGRGGSKPVKSVMLTKGDWLDVMDSDGVWNVARVLSVPSPGEVKIKYDGWPPEYDETVSIDSDRVAPYHTYTWSVKCWVRYLNWPLWPSLITIRPPGNEEGIEHLRRENRLFVDFLDNPDFSKRDRCWNPKRNVRAFDKDFDENRKRTNGDLFENSLQLMLQSNAAKQMPKFAKGTLPAQYAKSVTEPVSEARRTMGEDLWLKNFANNQKRHFLTHVYEDIGLESRDALEEDSSSESDGASAPQTEKPLELTYKSENDSEETRPKRKTTRRKRSPRVQIPKADSNEMKPEVEGHPMSPAGPGGLFPSVLVMKDEIIVVDDDDDDSDRYNPKRGSKRTRLLSTSRPRRSFTQRTDPPQPLTSRKASPRTTTPRKAGVFSPRKASVEPFSPRRTTPQRLSSKRVPASAVKPSVSKPLTRKSKRKLRNDSSGDEDGNPPPEISFKADEKDVPPSRGGTPKQRKLPAKEIAAKTREDLNRRLGLDDSTDRHKQSWLSMLNQADAKDPPAAHISGDESEAKSFGMGSKRSRKTASGRKAATKWSQLDAEAMNGSENSFISPESAWMDNSIEYNGDAEAKTEEPEEPTNSPLSVRASPMPRRKQRAVSPKQDAARPRLVNDMNSVMDFDSVKTPSSLRGPPASPKVQLPAKPSPRVQARAVATSERQKKASRSHSNRSFLDQSIAAAQAVIASMGTTDEDGTESLKPFVLPKKKRAKATRSAHTLGDKSVSARTAEAKPTAATTRLTPSGVSSSSTISSSLWTPSTYEAAAIQTSNIKETKMSAFPSPPVIESAEVSPVRVESPANGRPDHPALFPHPVTSASAAPATLSSSRAEGLDRLLIAGESISSPMRQTLARGANPAPTSLASNSAPTVAAQAIPDIPRRFCMMRVGERVESAITAKTKARALQKPQHSCVLVSAPRKFGDSGALHLAIDDNADTGRKRDPSDLAPSAPLSLAHSMSHLSGMPPPSAASTSSAMMPSPPGTVFNSSAGFSIRSWFKRNVYTSFLSPPNQI